MIADHIIEIDYDVDNDCGYWTCECGMGGSASYDRVEFAAEKHVLIGESVVYRSRPSR